MVSVSDTIVLENKNLSVTLSVKDGLVISSIYDKLNDHEYLFNENHLFRYSITTNLTIGGYESEGTFDSKSDVSITKAYVNEEGTKLIVEAKANTYDYISFVTVVDTSKDEMTVQITVKNKSENAVYVRLNYPDYVSMSIPGLGEEAYAMVPSEVGWVGPYSVNSSYGNEYEGETGLPIGSNVMQVMAIYHAGGQGGIYFYDRTGDDMSDTPVAHMYINGKHIVSHWGKQIKAKAEVTSPVIAMGIIYDNDWHAAVDAYMEYQGELLENDLGIPEWLSEAGAVYAARREGTGGTYQAIEETGDLRTRIRSFYEMDDLLNEAEAFGTNVVVLVDYYEKADTIGLDDSLAERIDRMPYWNKGDYIPRKDLGGEEAFITGIQKIHDRGGKVIVYVEPFIIFQYSRLGKVNGELWAARGVTGALDTSYGLCYTMIPAYESWRNEVANICKRLVDEYNVDGIFLDSLGWQWNHWYYNQAEKKIYSLEEYNQGFILLNNRIRETIREIKPDAVVLSESAGGPLPAYNDGGWAAQNVWGNTTTAGAIWASPVRYASSSVNFITNGNDINGLNQVFAAGFSLALNDYWDDHKEYISKLVNIRKDYKDALIHGLQSYQPTTGETGVVAYCYEGTKNIIIPIVNTKTSDYIGEVALRVDQAGHVFTDLLSGETYTVAEDGTIKVFISENSLVILQRDFSKNYQQ